MTEETGTANHGDVGQEEIKIMTGTEKGHPKGLYVLFVTEMWERFSYYGMRAIFTLFLTKALLYDKAFATDGIYGSYTGLVYLTPLIGGYVADKYWGNRKSIIIGGLLMAMGQFLMFTAASFYTEIDLARLIMFFGLGFLIFGNGFFKPNISTMVGQLYPEGDKRVDSAFTIFYMGINLGAFFSPLICGGLGEKHVNGAIVPSAFRWGFMAAGIGMLISVGLFVWLKNHYIVAPDGRQIGTGPNTDRQVKTTAGPKQNDFTKGQVLTWAGITLALFFIFFFGLRFDLIGSFIFSFMIGAPGLIISDRSLSKIESQRIWVIYIVAFFVIFFWSAFEQAGATLTYFAEEQTDRVVNKTIDQLTIRLGLAALILVLGWLLKWAITKLKNEKVGVRELFSGLFIIGIAFCGYQIYNAPAEGMHIDEVPASFFQSINAIAIVIFAPFFAMMWGALGGRKLEPASPYKQAIGLFLLALGYLLISYRVKDLDPWVRVSSIWLISLYIIHTFGELCLSPIGLSMVNKLAPIKFASLLMGVWFLSTAGANKFAGMLGALYPDPVKVEMMEGTPSAFSALQTSTLDTAAIWKLSAKENTSIMQADIKFATTKAVEDDNAFSKIWHALRGKEGDKENVVSITPASGNIMQSISVYKLKIIRGMDGNFDKAFASTDGKKIYCYKKEEQKTKEGTKVSENVEIFNVDPAKPRFLGMEIKDLHDFFMIFVYMAGLSSIVLFFLCRKLLAMMHGVR